MKRKLKLFLGIIFLSLLTTNLTYAQSVDNCNILHRGNFTSGNIDNLIKVNIKGKKHIEYHNNEKYYIKSKLNWVSDCEYNMTMKKVTIPDFPFGKGDVMNIKIKKVDGNKIYYTSTVNGQSWDGVFTKTD
jgi:hypothetical protein